LCVDLVTREIMYSETVGPTALGVDATIREVVDTRSSLLLISNAVREIVLSNQSGVSKARLSGLIRETVDIVIPGIDTAGIVLEAVDCYPARMNVAGLVRELVDVAQTTYMTVGGLAEELITTYGSTLHVNETVREVLMGTVTRAQPNIFLT
jgi:hypothetical protein